MTATDPLRVAVVGAGAFGRNHLRVYKELEQAGEAVRLVGVIDRDSRVAAEAAAKFGVPAFDSIEACLEATGLDAASVCVPTVHHRAAAEQLIVAGVDVLIEKPMAASLADADRILALAREHRARGAGGASGAVQSGGDGGAAASAPADVL